MFGAGDGLFSFLSQGPWEVIFRRFLSSSFLLSIIPGRASMGLVVGVSFFLSNTAKGRRNRVFFRHALEKGSGAVTRGFIPAFLQFIIFSWWPLSFFDVDYVLCERILSTTNM